MARRLLPIVQPGNVLREYLPEEATKLSAAWLEAYGANRHGVNAKAYMWHVFSGARYPSVAGDEAIREYLQQRAAKYVVLSNDRRFALDTDLLPEQSSLADYYVFPKNLAWTMAFTHEDGWLGPYFARHRNFAALDEENRANVEKARQAEVARKRGWR